MIFVSLVGTQTYAIRNPFIAAKTPLNLNKAALLCTSYTESYAKGQGAFLSLWAKKHGAAIYTNDKGFLKRLNDSSFSLQMEAPPPTAYLRLAGFSLNNSGYDISLKTHEKSKFILEFFEACLKSNISLSDMFKRTIKVKGYKWKIGSRGQRELQVAGRKNPITLAMQGKWFEQLIGYAMKDCGADDSQVRIRTDCNTELRDFLVERYHLENEPHKVFMTDLDVTARFGSYYYVISCKTDYIMDNLNRDINEVAAMASLFGRFGVSMYCSFNYPGEPDDSIRKNVFVFGPKTFTNPEAMKDLLIRAREGRQTTRTI